MSQSRQLAAIMFIDIVGYTVMMQQNEEKAVAVIKHYNATLEKWVAHFLFLQCLQLNLYNKRKASKRGLPPKAFKAGCV